MKLEYQIIKKKDDCCINVEQFINLLKTNNEIKINSEESKILYKKFDLSYKIEICDVKETNDVMFIIEFETKTNSSETAEIFDRFDEKFLYILKFYSSEMNQFYVNTLVDEISEYYGRALYPKIHEIELMMRKIIYLIMGKINGNEWTNDLIPRQVSKSILRTEENQKENENKVLKDFLSSADFIDLGNFLFEKYPNKEISGLIDDLKRIKDDGKVYRSVQNKIELYECKTNYERFFSDSLNDNNLKNEWSELYKFRCKIAHNKRFRKKDYDKAVKIINKLNDQFIKCINKIKITDYDEKDVVAMKDALQLAIHNISNYNIDNIMNNIESTVSLYQFYKFNILKKLEKFNIEWKEIEENDEINLNDDDDVIKEKNDSDETLETKK